MHDLLIYYSHFWLSESHYIWIKKCGTALLNVSRQMWAFSSIYWINIQNCNPETSESPFRDIFGVFYTVYIEMFVLTFSHAYSIQNTWTLLEPPTSYQLRIINGTIKSTFGQSLCPLMPVNQAILQWLCLQALCIESIQGATSTFRSMWDTNYSFYMIKKVCVALLPFTMEERKKTGMNEWLIP